MSAARVAVGVTVGVPLVVYLFQEQLLFRPQPLHPTMRRFLSDQLPGVREVELRAEDGTTLHGWLRAGEGAGPRPVVLAFGGNAEEISWMVAEPPVPRQWSIAAFNYRGYGLSGGKPSQRALFADALAIHDHLAALPDVDASRVVVLGRSLGSGVAVHLADHRPLAGAILVTPYDSVRSVAENVYPYLPVKLLLKHPFDSLARAGGIATPALFLAAGEDRVIPPRHARRLYEGWAGPKEWSLLDEADHNTVVEAAEFEPGIARFLTGLDAL